MSSTYNIAYEISNKHERFLSLHSLKTIRELQRNIKLKSGDEEKFLIAIPDEELENEYHFLCVDENELSLWSNGLDNKEYFHEVFYLFNSYEELLDKVNEFNLDVDEIVIFKSRIDKNEGTILLEKYETLSR